MMRNERKLNHIKVSVKTREARKRVGEKKKRKKERNEDIEHGKENSYKCIRY